MNKKWIFGFVAALFLLVFAPVAAGSGGGMVAAQAQGGEAATPTVDPSVVEEAQTPNDQVVADDLIVQGNACIGVACPNGLVFPYKPLVLQDSVLRILFNDTSPVTDPNNDWAIVVNDETALHGTNYFAIQDYTHGYVPFKIAANAQDNTIYISSQRSVGINTTNPVETLHIAYPFEVGIALESTNGAQAWSLHNDGIDLSIIDGTHVRIPLTVKANAPTSSLVVDSTGNVGLGTSAPLGNLHVKADTPDLVLEKISPAQVWGISGDESALWVTDATHARVPLWISANARNYSLAVDNSGHVGIGTNTPVGNLHVKADTPGLVLENTSPVQVWGISGDESALWVTDATHVRFPLWISANAQNYSLAVTSNGNVGLGTNAPAARLDVSGGLLADGFTVEASTPASTLYVDSSGRVGIGAATPAQKLHVAGNAYVSGNLGLGVSAPTEKLHVAGNMYATGNLLLDGYVNERSDVAAKTAFAPVNGQDVLERLSSVPIRTWSYKDSPEVRHIGPTAQDFRAAYGFGPDDKHLAALDTNGVALAAIQALEAQGKEKDARIQNLQSQVDDLRLRLHALEGRAPTRAAAWLWNQVTPLAFGLLGVLAGAFIARKKPTRA